MADLFGHERPPVAPGMVEIACGLRAETRDAVAIVADGPHGLRFGREHWTWLPLSYVDNIVRLRKSTAIVVIPEWLARQERLI
jgi:hypothetical protein